jgi:hypothetical protein
MVVQPVRQRIPCGITSSQSDINGDGLQFVSDILNTPMARATPSGNVRQGLDATRATNFESESQMPPPSRPFAPFHANAEVVLPNGNNLRVRRMYPYGIADGHI